MNDYTRVRYLVDNLLEDRGIKLDRDSVSYKVLCRELLKALPKWFKVFEDRKYGIYDTDPVVQVHKYKYISTST